MSGLRIKFINFFTKICSKNIFNSEKPCIIRFMRIPNTGERKGEFI